MADRCLEQIDGWQIDGRSAGHAGSNVQVCQIDAWRCQIDGWQIDAWSRSMADLEVSDRSHKKNKLSPYYSRMSHEEGEVRHKNELTNLPRNF